MVPPEKKLQLIQAIDKQLRSNIADLYVSLNELGDPEKAVQVLSVHASMLIDMINEIKKRQQ